MSEEQQEKRGFFSRVFGKKDKEEELTTEETPEVETGETPASGAEEAPVAQPVEQGTESLDAEELPVEAPVEEVFEERIVEETKAEEIRAKEVVVEKVPPEEPPCEEVEAEEVEAPEGSADEVLPDEEVPERKGLFKRLKKGLSRTRGGFVKKIDRALFGKPVVDEETLEALEEVLLTADIGVATSLKLVEEVADRVRRRELTDPEVLRAHLKTRIAEILIEDEGHLDLGPERPYVVLVVGVNGVGKTTTIGKIAAQFTARGDKVIIGAADTFRAAAIEQLAIWGERAGAQVIKHEHGSDPAAVTFDTLEAAKARGADLVLIDTAGRLHTKSNLMEEIKKIRRVAGKAIEGAPHEVMLVLDSTTGQNAISQAKTFNETVNVDSIALTKLDGTAKGGVIVGICDELKIPVKFIGIGEQVDDLRPFNAAEFVEALFSD